MYGLASLLQASLAGCDVDELSIGFGNRWDVVILFSETAALRGDPAGFGSELHTMFAYICQEARGDLAGLPGMERCLVEERRARRR